ncbi:MAG: metalloregulator ArsR/SmtB family transcription factor [Flavobacteriales bacterium]|nr:metalloregulator ArsR/SmtB family transcription factor [Flavobacteriales bacterium]
MGITKTEGFSTDILRKVTLMKSLAHPARLAIVEHLLATPNCICGDLQDVVGLAQPTISQHLKEMKNAGLIEGTVTGSRVCYCINEHTFQELADFFNERSEHFAERNKCC